MAKALDFEVDFQSIFIFNNNPVDNESKVIFVKNKRKLVELNVQFIDSVGYFVGMIPKNSEVMYSTKFGDGTSYNTVQTSILKVKNNSQITGRLGLLTTLYIYNILILLLLNRK